jgi:hypothetical protein
MKYLLIEEARASEADNQFGSLALSLRGLKQITEQNTMTPKSEKWLQWETLMEKHAKRIRAAQPDLSDDDRMTVLLAVPEIETLGKQLTGELRRRMAEKLIDDRCFSFTRAGKRLVMPDDKLLRMTDRQLAAWAIACHANKSGSSPASAAPAKRRSS